jgi:hypothetical protein
MRHEIIYNQPDGSKLKATVTFHDSDYSDMALYRVELEVCPKGKRTYTCPYDTDSYTFRALSMKNRNEYIKSQVIEILGRENYNDALNQTWEKLKPDFID